MVSDTTDTVPEQIPGQIDALHAEDAKVADMTIAVRILVLQRGWVVVGRMHELVDERGQLVEILLNDAQVIRRWGTTRGLGQLVDGPKEDTVLDPAGVVRVHPLGVVLQIEANPAGWQDHLQ